MSCSYSKSSTEPKNPLILRDVILSNALANVSHRGIELLTDSLSTFCVHLKKSWKDCGYRTEYFIAKNEAWLNKAFEYPEEFLQPQPSSIKGIHLPKPFEDLSNKQKMLRIEELKASYSGEELLFAAKMNSREGHYDKAKIIGKIPALPADSEELKKLLSVAGEKSDERTFSSETALALTTSLNLSKSKYLILRTATMDAGFKIFPSYYQLCKTKKECFFGKT